MQPTVSFTPTYIQHEEDQTPHSTLTRPSREFGQHPPPLRLAEGQLERARRRRVASGAFARRNSKAAQPQSSWRSLCALHHSRDMAMLLTKWDARVAVHILQDSPSAVFPLMERGARETSRRNIPGILPKRDDTLCRHCQHETASRGPVSTQSPGLQLHCPRPLQTLAAV